jgi:methyltransferase (TIGR00027 family)
VQVFEVDLPAVQNDKKKKLQKYLGRLPENITYLPIDFSTQTLESVFQGTSFDPSRLAMFVWEGVTQYLSEEDVQRTLSFVGKSAPGSLIAFTYVLKSIIERRSGIPGVEKMLDRVAKNNAPWRFGLEPSTIQEYLQPYHMILVEDVGNTDYQERYLQPLKRHLTVTEGERIVKAVVARP